ncbi:hypothetical protein DUI87_01105 [Hirundo rustica rustica]|nr:hypothetical protein DUI87_01105 [Hirundo rustica rustica]
MPAGFKTDPLLGKAKTISNGGGTSVINIFAKKKVTAQKQLPPEKRGVRICESNNCRHQGQCRRRCSRHQSRISPAAYGEDHGEADVPLQPMEVNGEAGGCLKVYVTHWKPMMEQAPGRNCDPVEGTYGGAVNEELYPVGRTHIGKVHRELLPIGRTQHWSRGRMLLPGEEVVVEM